MDLIIELLLGKYYDRNNFTLGNLHPDYWQLVQSFTVNNSALVVYVKARFYLTDVVFVGEWGHDHRVSEEIALFIFLFVTAARVLVPQRSHNWSAISVFYVC